MPRPPLTRHPGSCRDPRRAGRPACALFPHPAALAFLLVEGDAGFLLGRAVAGEAELLTLAVAPESRRLGLGRRLVARFVYQARLRQAQRAFLEVSAENPAAIALYDSAGFRTEGRRRGYYATPGGPRVDALVMARDL